MAVPGNGPNTTIRPWTYPCRVSTATEGIEKTLTATTQTAQFQDEKRVLFGSMRLVTAACDELGAPLEPPFLLYCPASCMSVGVEKHEKLLQIGSPSPRFRQTQRREIGSDDKSAKPDYTIEDAGNR